MDREKVIREFEHLLNTAKGNYQDFVDLTVDGGEEILALLKEQEAEKSKISNAYLELVGKASKQPEIVRCKDCKKRYKKSCGYYYADGRIMCDDWFCADGVRS